MASLSGGTKKRLVSSLDGEVLERLSMKLNPSLLLKDYRTLAGRFKYTYEYIENFARQLNPTLALLSHWWSSKKGREKTVSVLIEHLSEMERDDAVDLLRPYEFHKSHEAEEYDEDVDYPVIKMNNLDLNRNLPLKEKEFHQNKAACQGDDNIQIPGIQQTNNFPIAAYSNEQYQTHDGSTVGDSTMYIQLPDGTSYHSLPQASGHDMTVASDKVALVIGNKDYVHPKLRGLQYPEQDAADVAQLLSELGFKVVSLINLTHSEMRTAMLAFCCLLGKGVYGVFYFAGHGYEDSGETFLLPIDSDLQYKRDESLRTEEILQAMQQCETSLNLLIIDACRVSLPNKSGVTVPRVKRNVKGNTIFAYSCCSLQESLEEADRRNGLYCFHLLQRLRENRRIENILMDVATDFAKMYQLEQRPCIETDCVMDFRLTDPISLDSLSKDVDEHRERCRRWMDANRYPNDFWLTASHLKFHLQFKAEFCNTLHITLTTVESTAVQVTEVTTDLQTRQPLSCVREMFGEYNKNKNILPVQTFKIINIQKLYKLQETLILSINAMYKINNKLVSYNKDLDLGWPLVSSVMCLWDKWLLGDQCKSTTV